MYFAVLGIVFFASTAMMVREGLWSNAITLVNIIISGLVAFGFFSPLALWLDESLDGEFTYLVDFVSIWVLFIVTMVVLKVVANALSKTRMRFKNPVDQPVGGSLMALIAAEVLVGFVLATFHTAPLPEGGLGGAMAYSDSEVESNSGLMNPDLAWLRFVERVSGPQALGSGSGGGFSAKAFVKIYRDHRKKFEAAPGLKIRRG
jgi:hypothetical protein